jgi:hypothetical protein
VGRLAALLVLPLLIPATAQTQQSAHDRLEVQLGAGVRPSSIKIIMPALSWSAGLGWWANPRVACYARSSWTIILGASLGTDYIDDPDQRDSSGIIGGPPSVRTFDTALGLRVYGTKRRSYVHVGVGTMWLAEDEFPRVSRDGRDNHDAFFEVGTGAELTSDIGPRLAIEVGFLMLINDESRKPIVMFLPVQLAYRL